VSFHFIDAQNFRQLYLNTPFLTLHGVNDFQELGRYKAQTKLPFNAFGTMAMAREVRVMQIKQ
jgi:hypothetical protein